MYFNPDIPALIIYLLGAAAALMIVAVSYAMLQSLRISRTRRFCDIDEAAAAEAGLPYEPVSVVIYSQDEAEALESLLRSIIAQDYPEQMEIIVVNEGDSLQVRDVVGTLQLAFPRLYLTYTPDGARNLSRKKLALTLGIKAARYDTVVLTAVGAEIRSDRWLRAMMRHFAPGGSTEVVVGFAAQMPEADRGRGARCRAFDTAVGAARWLGAAIAGHPFRASEFNVAYRREVFFRNKGFSRSLNLHFGDDDIFISEIARKDNTAVELGHDSIVGLLAHDYRYVLHRSAMRHAFTESHIRRRPRVWATVSTWAVPLSIGCAAAAVALDAHNWFTIAAAALCALLLCVCTTLSWRKVLAALDMRRLGGTLFALSLGYPLRRLMLRVSARFSKQKRYTWD